MQYVIGGKAHTSTSCHRLTCGVLLPSARFTRKWFYEGITERREREGFLRCDDNSIEEKAATNIGPPSSTSSSLAPHLRLPLYLTSPLQRTESPGNVITCKISHYNKRTCLGILMYLFSTTAAHHSQPPAWVSFPSASTTIDRGGFAIKIRTNETSVILKFFVLCFRIIFLRGKCTATNLKFRI